MTFLSFLSFISPPSRPPKQLQQRLQNLVLPQRRLHQPTRPPQWQVQISAHSFDFPTVKNYSLRYQKSQNFSFCICICICNIMSTTSTIWFWFDFHVLFQKWRAPRHSPQQQIHLRQLLSSYSLLPRWMDLRPLLPLQYLNQLSQIPLNVSFRPLLNLSFSKMQLRKDDDDLSFTFTFVVSLIYWL